MVDQSNAKDIIIAEIEDTFTSEFQKLISRWKMQKFGKTQALVEAAHLPPHSSYLLKLDDIAQLVGRMRGSWREPILAENRDLLFKPQVQFGLEKGGRVRRTYAFLPDNMVFRIPVSSLAWQQKCGTECVLFPGEWTREHFAEIPGSQSSQIFQCA